MLGSDRAKAFIHAVTADLAKTFGIEQVIGTAFHPEAQSAVERPHREYRSMCRAFMSQFHDWDQVAPLFQWTVRTSAKKFNALYTPYEVVLGLKPRQLLDASFSPAIVRKQPVEDYVKDLVNYLKKVHVQVAEHQHRVRDHEQGQRLRQRGVGGDLQV